MAVVTICSDFGAQENKVSHCFRCFPIYLPWSDGTGCHDLLFLNVEFTFCCCCWVYSFWMLNLSLIEPRSRAAQGNKGRKYQACCSQDVQLEEELKQMTGGNGVHIGCCCFISCSVVSNSWDPMDGSLPGFSVRGILQVRILEWVAISFSRGSSQLRDQTWVSRIAGRFFTIWATREALIFF